MPAPHGEPLCVCCRRHPVEPAWRPFCSQRCKLQDLARWADGTYRVGGDSLPDDDDDNEGKSEKAEGKS